MDFEPYYNASKDDNIVRGCTTKVVYCPWVVIHHSDVSIYLDEALTSDDNGALFFPHICKEGRSTTL